MLWLSDFGWKKTIIIIIIIIIIVIIIIITACCLNSGQLSVVLPLKNILLKVWLMEVAWKPFLRSDRKKLSHF